MVESLRRVVSSYGRRSRVSVSGCRFHKKYESEVIRVKLQRGLRSDGTDKENISEWDLLATLFIPYLYGDAWLLD